MRNEQPNKGFKVEIIADSINPKDNRVTTFMLTYPRFIHSEVLTHRAFSRNAASSRAIPVEKIMEQIRVAPAKPVRWGKNGKGMQDHGEMIGSEAEYAEDSWFACAEGARSAAATLLHAGLHKQIVNRVMEPFMWMTTLVTATQFENFFSLRVHKDAQPEFQFLSYLMLKQYVNAVPEKKNWLEWHIPFGDKMPEGLDIETKLKIATARAARTSYLTIGNDIDVAKDIELHDRLAASGHWSPFEHACYACDADKINGNFVGWDQYRHTFPNENRHCDLKKLLENYEREMGYAS